MENFFINPKILPKASDPNALILHPHAQRTGGNTMRRLVFAKVYGPEHVYSRMYRTTVPWKETSDAVLADVRVVCDHFDLRENKKITRPLLPIAVIRHPLYRTVSLYHFVRRKKTHREHALARELGLEAFYEQAVVKYPRYYKNLQCRRICSVDDARIALEWIDEKFLGVGYTEQLDEFVVALGNIFGWPTLDVRGAQPDFARYDALITPQFRERVLADNAQDLLLWETMKKGAPLALPFRAPKEEARTVFNRTKQWAKKMLGR